MYRPTKTGSNVPTRILQCLAINTRETVQAWGGGVFRTISDPNSPGFLGSHSVTATAACYTSQHVNHYITTILNGFQGSNYRQNLLAAEEQNLYKDLTSHTNIHAELTITASSPPRRVILYSSSRDDVPTPSLLKPRRSSTTERKPC